MLQLANAGLKLSVEFNSKLKDQLKSVTHLWKQFIVLSSCIKISKMNKTQFPWK